MKAQSKNRKSPTCSRCRFHGERDVRVLQHKCPYKDCSCSDCLLVKKRSITYRAQKNLDKQDENSNEVSSPGSGSTGSSRCLGSPQIPMHPGNMGDSNEPSLQNPWSTNHQQPPQPPLQQQLSQQLQQQQQQQQHHHQQQQIPPASLIQPPPPPHQLPPSSINSIPSNKNSGISNISKIKNFQTLCLTFPDHTPSQLQTLFAECGEDYEKTIDRILENKWYSEVAASSNDYQSLTNDPNYSNNHINNNNNNNNNSNNNIKIEHNNNTNSNNNNNSSNHNHHHNHNTNHNNNTNSNNNNNNHNNLEYPTNEDDKRLSFANCHYNQQQAPRMMTAPNFNNQDYTGDELVNMPIQPHNSDAMAPDWSYSDTARYPTATSNYSNNNNNNNTWNQGDYPAWSNASSNFWPSNGHTNYSYVDQNDANAMSYYYGRREMEYPESAGHLDRTVKPEPNISSNYDFDSY